LEKRAAFFTFLFLFGGGFLILLGDLSLTSFADSITVNIGSLQVKQPELGTARYEIMVDIGIISMTLGIISILSYTYPKSKFWSNVILFSVVLFTILFTLKSGSRIGVVLTVVQYLLLSVWFGYKPNKNFVILGVLLTIVIVGSITVIRGNRLLERSSTGVVNQIITGEAGREYFSSVSSPVAPLLAFDRVRIMAIVLQYVEGEEDYVHGESIVAGIGNLITELSSRIGLLDPEQKTDLNWANEIIRKWLFYDIVPVGSLPPSLPGEFYMQWGWWSFITLSVLFGWVLLILRRKLSSSASLLSRWLILIIVFRLISIIPTEMSALASMVMYITPIVLVYLSMTMLFNKIQSTAFP
jgi:oligosaccharide repeat unit polymerase